MIANGTVIAADVANSSITPGKLEANTSGTVLTTDGTNVIWKAQSALSIANTQVTGLITAAQIANIANTQITGNITSSQIAANAVTQTAIASGVAGTGPAFSAYRSTNQVISFTTWTKVALNAEDFDTNNNFDPTTNYRFTPTVAGYYQFNGVVAVQSSSTLTRVILALWKNNSQVLRGSDLPFSAGTSVVFTSVPGLIYMNGSTDYMELYIYTSGSGTPTILANGGEYPTLSGFLARAA